MCDLLQNKTNVICHQMIDTVAAYLNQKQPEDAKPLYVKFPKLVALALNRNPDTTYRVKKNVYGFGARISVQSECH